MTREGKPVNRGVIQREYRDADGYWIELSPGWQNSSDPGTHAIVEDTRAAAYAKLACVTRCACQDCQQLRGNA